MLTLAAWWRLVIHSRSNKNMRGGQTQLGRFILPEQVCTAGRQQCSGEPGQVEEDLHVCHAAGLQGHSGSCSASLCLTLLRLQAV